MHSKNPRGSNLVHRGREGLEASMELIRTVEGDSKISLIITDRVEYTSGEVNQGAVVVDVPAYLRGLACMLSSEGVEFVSAAADFHDTVSDSRYDATIIASGAATPMKAFVGDLEGGPRVHFVRGQSVLFQPVPDNAVPQAVATAKVFGHYVLPQRGQGALVGSTREWEESPPAPWFRAEVEVLAELKEKSLPHASDLWDSSSYTVEKILRGTRVQVDRTDTGRLPIVAKLNGAGGRGNRYLFSGLGSRGLLYHVVYGRDVAEMVVRGLEEGYRPE